MKLNKQYCLKIMQACAPTSTSDDDEAETFYDNISDITIQINTLHTIIRRFQCQVGKETMNPSQKIRKLWLWCMARGGGVLLNYLL